MLFHVSEQSDIRRFDPRPAANVERPVVWAVHADRLHNYLVPRDCPRVTFYAGANTTADDAARLLGDDRAVVAIESAWLERARQTRLFVYMLPPATFALVDVNAGYYHSAGPVEPLGVETIDDGPAAIAARGVSLRVLPSLWLLYDEVIASTLSYSIIRMRNAQPRGEVAR